MRPVERGACPQHGGKDMVFPEYGRAKPYLIDRMGEYCSYCEIQLSAPQVEHIRGKKKNPDLACEWTNFLLACGNCNPTKGEKIVTSQHVEHHLWPDVDASFRAFVYGEAGMVQVATGADEARAQATAEMVGLCRRPGAGLTREQLLKATDCRWMKRREAWNEAIEARNDLTQYDNPGLRRSILALARAKGFWSVWMTVFAEDSQMLAALCRRDHFPGTARDRL